MTNPDTPAAAPTTWHLLTGEYPPDPGGVADYAAALAAGLTAVGCKVHVWCPGAADAERVEAGAVVHRLPGRFGLRALARLGQALDRFPPPRTLLVQYVPQAFGWKAMNVPFCLWLGRRRRRGDDVRTMFHEAVFPFVRAPLAHNLIAAVTRLMARIVLAASRRTYVSTPAWNPYLDAAGGRRTPREWTPIPSNVPSVPQPETVALRARLTGGRPEALVVGNFGAAPGLPRQTLFAVAKRLLAELPAAVFLFVGRDGEALRAELAAELSAEFAGRLAASGQTSLALLAAHVQACDLAVQPFIDGISTRRTSGMAWLANGVPMVANLGPSSEPLWAADRLAPIAERLDADEVATLALKLARDPAARRAGGERGRSYYDANFSLARTVRTLIAEVPA